MCEANAYVVVDGQERLIMENVDVLKPENERIYLQNIYGEQRWIEARIKEMSLVNHRIVLMTQ
ncbi:MAG: CooT family nickel-binding protein [Syntrophobacteraceae bacterium]|nr:CooT family nickel-binding protein [Syntrophobacteraceae bacterium]